MKKYKATYIIEADDEAEAEEKFNELDIETIKDSVVIEEEIIKDDIKILANNLIKAIDENCFEDKDKDISRENDTDIFITQRFIADELEELREVLK